MNTELRYRVAGCLFSLISSRPEATRALLADSFSPFEVIEQPQGEEAVFSILGDTSLSPPEVDLILRPSPIAGVRTAQHEAPGVSWMAVAYGMESPYYIRRLRGSRYVETTFTLTDPRERYLISKVIWRTLIDHLTARKVVHLHASVVELHGRALLLLGVSGAGKSTHARLWQTYIPGATLINDDEAFVSIAPGAIRVHGSPWSGKTPCYRNASADVVAMIHIQQAESNRIVTLDDQERMAMLILSTITPDERGTLYPLHMSNLFSLLARTPIYRLECRADEEAVRLSKQILDQESQR